MRAVAILVALAIATPALGAQAYAVSVEELARGSDAVVHGKVGSSHVVRSDDGMRLSTVFEIRTQSVLRGHAPAVAQVVIPGGVDGRFGQRVDAAPSLAGGEEVIVFLTAERGGVYAVTGLAQGKFSIAGAQARPELKQFTFVRTSVPPGERRSEEMPVAELERRVRSTR